MQDTTFTFSYLVFKYSPGNWLTNSYFQFLSCCIIDDLADEQELYPSNVSYVIHEPSSREIWARQPLLLGWLSNLSLGRAGSCFNPSYLAAKPAADPYGSSPNHVFLMQVQSMVPCLKLTLTSSLQVSREYMKISSTDDTAQLSWSDLWRQTFPYKAWTKLLDYKFVILVLPTPNCSWWRGWSAQPCWTQW